MSEQVLNILKLSLLGLIYLFFGRVLWAVWSEVRTPSARSVTRTSGPVTEAPVPHPQAGPQPVPAASPYAATAAQPRPTTATPADSTASSKRSRKPPKGRGGRAARLVILEPRHRRGTAVAIGGGEITLGRDPACTISIQDDSYVSTLHLRVYDYDGQPMVEDLGSTNGTFHNGNKMKGSKLLQPGDRIQVGTTVIEAQ
jgi:pSer/pThr/pTyr-binding forkhead associated (FHA) protein